MKIVDAHTHLGDTRLFDHEIWEDDLIKTMDENEVDISVVQPDAGALDPIDVHNRIYRLGKRYPGRIYGMANINPHTSPRKYKDELRRVVQDFGFVAVKLHTLGHVVTPLTKDGGLVFETATELKIPVVIHTGAWGMPMSLPCLCLPRLEEYPEVTVVLAHAGAPLLTMEAIFVAKSCDRVYLETSNCSKKEIINILTHLGSNRVMFGSDELENLAISLFQYREMGLTKTQQIECLGLTATQVFRLV